MVVDVDIDDDVIGSGRNEDDIVLDVSFDLLLVLVVGELVVVCVRNAAIASDVNTKCPLPVVAVAVAVRRVVARVLASQIASCMGFDFVMVVLVAVSQSARVVVAAASYSATVPSPRCRRVVRLSLAFCFRMIRNDLALLLELLLELLLLLALAREDSIFHTPKNDVDCCWEGMLQYEFRYQQL